MKTVSRFALALSSAFSLSVATGMSTGCASPANPGSSCSATPFISPTTATLDHTVAGNSQPFTTGIRYSGGCVVPALSIAYTWNVSDTIDSSINSDGVASCNNAALNPITVFTTVADYTNGPSNPPTYVASGLPSATLTCK